MFSCRFCFNSNFPVHFPTLRSPSPPPPPPLPLSSPPRSATAYPGVNSLKKIKVSPPKPGSLYPQIGVEESSSDDTDANQRPETSMSDYAESVAPSEVPSEAPSLGAAIKKAANAHR